MMPMDLSRYPQDWPAMSNRIREEAGQKCEWCGAPNGRLIARNPENPEQWADIDTRAGEAALDRAWPVTRIVLTVAHIDAILPDGTEISRHDKSHTHREALKALCQRCHLNYDHADHVRHAAETRLRRKIAAGQQELLSMPLTEANGRLNTLYDAASTHKEGDNLASPSHKHEGM